MSIPEYGIFSKTLSFRQGFDINASLFHNQMLAERFSCLVRIFAKAFAMHTKELHMNTFLTTIFFVIPAFKKVKDWSFGIDKSLGLMKRSILNYNIRFLQQHCELISVIFRQHDLLIKIKKMFVLSYFLNMLNFSSFSCLTIE